MSRSNENGPPPIPNQATPPPIPKQVDGPPPEKADDDKEEEEKPKTQKDILTSIAVGAVLLYFGGVDEKLLEPAMAAVPMLLLTWLLSRVEFEQPPWSQQGLGGSIWTKIKGIWSNHGGGFYGLVTVGYFVTDELGRIQLDWPDLTFNAGALMKFFFVDRFINMGVHGWQAFLWPLNWLGSLGFYSMLGFVLISFNLYELIRRSARFYSQLRRV